MMLADQVFAHAQVLAGEMDERQYNLLQVLSYAATASLIARLREGLSPEDCKADFLAAASLFALASLSAVRETETPEQIKLGDVTLQKRGADAASNCLRSQAELIIAPYLRDNFTFVGV